MITNTLPNGTVAREGMIWLSSCSLWVRDIGEGQPIVVLHGGPDFDHTYLLPELDRLAQSFRLIYYDQRGRGRSGETVQAEDVTLESEIDDIETVRQFFGLETMCVLGHSWGTMLAMEYAIRNPNCVSRLILMNPSPASRADLLFYQEERERRTPGVRSSLRQLAVGILYRQGDLQAEVEYYRIHFGPTLRDTRLLEELISRLRRNFSREGLLKARQIETRLYEQTWDQEKFDLLPGLKELKTPTLVIHGEYDLVPVECAIHIADAIPRARLEVLQDYGHFAYMENIEVVMRVVEEWMKVVRSDE